MESRNEITRYEMDVLPSSEAKDTTATSIVDEEEKVGQVIDSQLKMKSRNPPPEKEVLLSSEAKDTTASATITDEEERVGQVVDSNLKTKCGNPPPEKEVLPSSETKDTTTSGETNSRNEVIPCETEKDEAKDTTASTTLIVENVVNFFFSSMRVLEIEVGSLASPNGTSSILCRKQWTTREFNGFNEKDVPLTLPSTT